MFEAEPISDDSLKPQLLQKEESINDLFGKLRTKPENVAFSVVKNILNQVNYVFISSTIGDAFKCGRKQQAESLNLITRYAKQIL